MDSQLRILCKGITNDIDRLIKTYGTQQEPTQQEPKTPIILHRLNYIGSKFQLLDWITEIMLQKTGWTTFEDKRIADLFAGTGIVSHHFRSLNSIITSNDAELYSYIITHAFTRSIYSPTCQTMIAQIQTEIAQAKHKDTVGFITTKYSPYSGCERKFFTVENAKRIDYIRARIEQLRNNLDPDEYKFMVASLLLSADAVSNVPAVYGCYLKEFKAKATRTLVFQPIHNNTCKGKSESTTFNSDVLSDTFLNNINVDLVYLDPPYNERQYSKNYFPLNMIALTPEGQAAELPLKGKTGIPESCFISPFCKKGVVEDAFDKLFGSLKTQWIFLSYSSESIVSKEKMLSLMGKYGDASVIERDYKRFKSFEYNEDKAIKEYLFCLKVTNR